MTNYNFLFILKNLIQGPSNAVNLTFDTNLVKKVSYNKHNDSVRKICGTLLKWPGITNKSIQIFVKMNENQDTKEKLNDCFFLVLIDTKENVKIWTYLR